MKNRKYTIITHKQDFHTKQDYAMMYYWENGVRKYDQIPMEDRYFFVDKEYYDNGSFKLPGLNFEIVKKIYKNVYDKEVYKIIMKSHLLWDQWKALGNLHKGYIFESDFKPLDRFLCDKKPKFSKNLRKWYIDIEILRNEKGEYSPPTEAKNKISAICIYDNVDKLYHVLLLNEKKDKNTLTTKGNRKIYLYKNEVEMMEKFLLLLEECQPDCFSGWNTKGFDTPYIINRLEEIGLDKRKLSPQWSVYQSSRTNNGYLSFYTSIKGRIDMDLMEISKLFWLGTDVGYSLKAQSKKHLNGYTKIELDDIDKAYYENFDLFVEYNIRDVELCVMLDEKLSLIKNMQSFQDIMSINLDVTTIAGTTIYYYFKQQTDYVLFNSFSKEVGKIPGGYVVPTEAGIFIDIKKLDFASHYPSFIRTYNISPEMMVVDPTEEEKKNLIHFYAWYRWGDPVTGSSGAVIVRNPTEAEKKTLEYFEIYLRKDKRGILPGIMDELTDQRLHYKHSGQTSLSNVYKRMLNSMYGILVAEYSRIPFKEGGKTITLGCQNLTKGVIEKVESKKIAKIIMGDTDSFCAKLNPGYEIKDLLDSMDYIFMENEVKFNLLPKNYSVLELEDEVDKMVLFGVKKKYAEKIGNKQKIIGMELIRKDAPLGLKDFQQEVISYIFANDNMSKKDLKIIKDNTIKKIRKAVIAKDYKYLGMPTVIKKPIEQYEGETMEKKALRNSGLKVSSSEQFYILFCQGENTDLAFKSVSDLKKLEGKFRIDFFRIIDRLFKNYDMWEKLFEKQASLFDY